MCGIAGVFDERGEGRVSVSCLARMVGALDHRGPEQRGAYLDGNVGLGHARLSIIDLAHGTQPLHNEDGSIWIVLNGEIFNYPELRTMLEARGHRFSTRSDTEVLIHLYEDRGSACVEDLNGQFAFGIWDSRKRSLLLARDHVGICPLYYTERDGLFLFASEIKALVASTLIPTPAMDPRALDQLFTFWATLPGRTAFEGISELRPGHTLTLEGGGRQFREYWDVPYYPASSFSPRPPRELSEQALALIMDATRIRLRADVPVGSYLSGGLDSSGITALISRHFNNGVKTFGVRFEETAFDEGEFQRQVAADLGVDHHELEALDDVIVEAFPRVVWHCETPILRTAPVPMYLLSRQVHDLGIKVVCTGEGADEVFGGYDIFREALVRSFVLRHPDSPLRARLLERLYPQIFRTSRAKTSLRQFLRRSPADPGDPFFSHIIRWNNTARIKQFFAKGLKDRLAGYSALDELAGLLPAGFDRRDTLSKAQYLEDKIFLSNYLLTSQGDRMAMAHAVEIRPPFLDLRIFEFMAHVSPRWKILGLDEKHLLKKAFGPVLPPAITRRTKHPYRAPIQTAFRGRLGSAVLRQALSEEAIARAGIFDAARVRRLVEKVDAGASRSETEGMALAGILSTQLLQAEFVETRPEPALPARPWDVLIDRRAGRSSDKD